jgi:hypothetical protein
MTFKPDSARKPVGGKANEGYSGPYLSNKGIKDENI